MGNTDSQLNCVRDESLEQPEGTECRPTYHKDDLVDDVCTEQLRKGRTVAQMLDGFYRQGAEQRLLAQRKRLFFAGLAPLKAFLWSHMTCHSRLGAFSQRNGHVGGTVISYVGQQAYALHLLREFAQMPEVSRVLIISRATDVAALVLAQSPPAVLPRVIILDVTGLMRELPRMQTDELELLTEQLEWHAASPDVTIIFISQSYLETGALFDQLYKETPEGLVPPQLQVHGHVALLPPGLLDRLALVDNAVANTRGIAPDARAHIVQELDRRERMVAILEKAAWHSADTVYAGTCMALRKFLSDHALATQIMDRSEAGTRRVTQDTFTRYLEDEMTHLLAQTPVALSTVDLLVEPLCLQVTLHSLPHDSISLAQAIDEAASVKTRIRTADASVISEGGTSVPTPPAPPAPSQRAGTGGTKRGREEVAYDGTSLSSSSSSHTPPAATHMHEFYDRATKIARVASPIQVAPATSLLPPVPQPAAAHARAVDPMHPTPPAAPRSPPRAASPMVYPLREDIVHPEETGGPVEDNRARQGPDASSPRPRVSDLDVA